MATPDPATAISWWTIASAFGGSLIGATIGATASFIVQRRSFTQDRRRRDEDRAEVRKARGYSLLFKLIRIASNIENLGKALQGSIEQARANGFTGAPWQMVQAIGPTTEEIHFSPEEMALVLSLDDKVFNDIAALDQLHNSTAAIFELYGEKREKVLARFGGVMSGAHVTTALTKEDVEWLTPRAGELNGLIEVMRQRSAEDGKDAWDGLLKVRDLFEAKLNIKHKLERKNSPA